MDEKVLKQLSSQLKRPSANADTMFHQVCNDLDVTNTNSRIVKDMQQKTAEIEAVLWHPCKDVKTAWTKLLQEGEAKYSDHDRQKLFKNRALASPQDTALPQFANVQQTRWKDWDLMMTHIKKLRDELDRDQTDVSVHARKSNFVRTTC